MKRKLHYFNPGHETAVLNGSPYYTPPANVLRMTQELSYLPLWYGDDGDYVLVDEIVSTDFLSVLPKEIYPLLTPISAKELEVNKAELPEFIAAPWGLSPQSIYTYGQLVSNYDLSIDIQQWKPIYHQLTGRETAAKCLKRIGELLSDTNIPSPPLFLSTFEDVEAYLAKSNTPSIVKAPYSSSGRGLLWLKDNKLGETERRWVRGILNRQDVVSIEPWLDKVQDFAMEFYLDNEGNISYEGLSVFDTVQRGVYSGNILQSQERLEADLQSKIGKDTFEQIVLVLKQSIAELYGEHYNGYLGVDMILYKDQDGRVSIHPCIEINMRYTMGMVAITLFEKYIHPSSTGIYTVSYENKEGEAYKKHLEMKEAFPLTFQDEKLRTGYLSLCPVTTETHYRAYILLE